MPQNKLFEIIFKDHREFIYLRNGLISSLVIFLILIVCFFFSLEGLPIGILVGTIIGCSDYFLRRFQRKIRDDNRAKTRLIVYDFLLSISRILLYVLPLLFLGIFYHQGYQIFSLYFALLGIFLIQINRYFYDFYLDLKNKDKKNDNNL